MIGRPATKEEYIEFKDKGSANLLQLLKQEGVVLLASQEEHVIFENKVFILTSLNICVIHVRFFYYFED